MSTNKTKTFGGWTAVKTIRSHAGLARLLANGLEKDAEGDLVVAGYIPRVEEIPSPFAYSPVQAVYREAGTGRHVFWREVAHKTYCLFELANPSAMRTEQDAEDAYVRMVSHRARTRTVAAGHEV